MSTLHKVGLGVGAYVGTNVVTSVAQRLVNSEGATTGGKYYAAEYAPAAIVGGVGAYFIAKEKNHDVGIPLIAGAAGSVVARMAARKVDQNGALYKYFLKYAGGAWSGEMIGDKTFGASTAVAPAPLPNQADVDLYNLMTEFNTLSKKAVEKHGEDIVNQPFAQAYAAAGTAFQKVVVDPKAQTLGLNGSATPEERAAFTTAATAAIEAMKAAGLSGIPKKSKLPKHASVGRVNTDENYEEVLRERQLQENRARAAQRNASRSASQRAKKSMGKYVTSSINPPVYQYEQPVRIPDSVMEQYVEPTETGRIYSGAAGFFPTDPKVAQRMQRMPVDHEHESEPAHSNGMGRYFAQGVDMSRVNADHDPDVEEMIEHLDAADPLTSEELKREGLSGYVTSTVVRATPASAMKLEEAGVAEILKQSDSEPNTALIRVNDLGQPVSKEYNPSVAVNTGFGPHQINYAGDVADDPSGLFTRGIFSSGFPKLR